MERGYSGGAEPWVHLRNGGGWAGLGEQGSPSVGGKDLGERVGSIGKVCGDV